MATIHSDTSGPVATIRFDNPNGGFLTAAMVHELDRITTQWSADASIRAVVLTGTRPGTFITHFSPEELAGISAQVRQMEDAALRRTQRTTRVLAGLLFRLEQSRTGSRLLDRLLPGTQLEGLHTGLVFHRVLQRLQSMDKVVIASINGDCMGGGLEISLACDYRLMARGDYSIGLPETISGIMPGAGGTQRLARLLGPNRAVQMILDGEFFDADGAEQAGLIDSAVDQDRLGDCTAELAARLANRPRLSVLGTKRTIYGGFDRPMAQALGMELRAFMTTCLSRDATRAGDYYLARYAEGRSPAQIFGDLRAGIALDFTDQM